MSVIVPISSALPLKADVAAVGCESPELTQNGPSIDYTVRQVGTENRGFRSSGLSCGSYWAIFCAVRDRGSSVTERTRIEAYLRRLYGYAFSLAGDHHQAEDLVQECAVRALTAKNTPRDERAYRAWLFRILRNAFLDQVRHKKTAVSATADENFAPVREFWHGANVLSPSWP